MSKQATRLNVAVLVMRIGMSFPFIFAGLNHIMHPEMAMALGVPGGIIFASIGALEVISGIGILLGLLTRPSALFQALIMLTTIFVLAKGDVGNPNLPAVWKDPALLGVALMLLIIGAGKFSIDAKLSEPWKTLTHHIRQSSPVGPSIGVVTPQVASFHDFSNLSTESSPAYYPGSFCTRCGIRFQDDHPFCSSCGRPRDKA
ncbi:MAG TPA: DoxX family protein [Candidatus Bathyarchaeia archaeon]|nr:DoxX family protein [Candidatus Bathyarchaeia archaeon]